MLELFGGLPAPTLVYCRSAIDELRQICFGTSTARGQIGNASL